MYKFLIKLLTRNRTHIPLFWIIFNYKKYLKDGEKDSCVVKIHPLIGHDEYIKNTLNHIVDYIRDNYNLNEL